MSDRTPYTILRDVLTTARAEHSDSADITRAALEPFSYPARLMGQTSVFQGAVMVKGERVEVVRVCYMGQRDGGRADLYVGPDLAEVVEGAPQATAALRSLLSQLIMRAAVENARELGREAGRTAGSWAADGNTSADHARKVLALIEDDGIGGEAETYLPTYPNLSGEWADDLTPIRLWENITGRDHSEAQEDAGMGYETLVGSIVDALAQAWEEGVGETYEDACVAELRAILPD